MSTNSINPDDELKFAEHLQRTEKLIFDGEDSPINDYTPRN
jgi:hypothetical protein